MASPALAPASRLALLVLSSLVLAGCSAARPEGTRPPEAATPAAAVVVLGTPASEAELARGSQLYDANCVRCHGGVTGGRMMDMPPRHNASGHTWHHADCQLVEIVLDGSGQMGRMMREMMSAATNLPPMPAWRGVLSEDDVTAVLAHVKTWWTDDQRRQQARLTEETCS